MSDLIANSRESGELVTGVLMSAIWTGFRSQMGPAGSLSRRGSIPAPQWPAAGTRRTTQPPEHLVIAGDIAQLASQIRAACSQVLQHRLHITRGMELITWRTSLSPSAAQAPRPVHG